MRRKPGAEESRSSTISSRISGKRTGRCRAAYSCSARGGRVHRGRVVMVRNSLALVLACVTAELVPFPASAEKPPPAPATSPKLDLARLRRALETGDEAAKIAALLELAQAPKASAPAAAALVNDVLVRGASAGVLE